MSSKNEDSRADQVVDITASPGWLRDLKTDKGVKWPASLDPNEGWNEALESVLTGALVGEK